MNHNNENSGKYVSKCNIEERDQFLEEKSDKCVKAAFETIEK